MKRIIIGILTVGLICSTVFANSITEIFNASSIRTSYYTENKKNHYFTVNVDNETKNSMEKNFDKGNYNYSFVDIIQNEKKLKSKPHTEIISFETDTKDLTKILPMLTAYLEIVTPDGYCGDVFLDMESINIKPESYAYKKTPITISRSYYQLPNADTSSIPKTIDDNGRTLTLNNVDWQSENVIDIDGQEVTNKYTATANYKTTVTTKYAKSYIVSATYKGEIFKEEDPTYTAIFLGQKLFNYSIIKIIFFILLIATSIFFIIKIIFKRRNLQ